MIGLCRFCDQERPLIDAHIVPEAFYREIKSDDDAMLFLVSSNVATHPKKTPIGPYDSGILCRECEDLFWEWDDYAIRLLIADRYTAFKRVVMGDVQYFEAASVDYRKLKLFMIAVAWRASVATHAAFKKVSLGKREQRAKELLRAREPGPENEFGVAMSRLTRGHTSPEEAPFVTTPVSRYYANGSQGVRVFLGGFVADICTGRKPLPEEIRSLEIRPDRPMFAVGLPRSEVTEVRNFGPAILHHGPKLLSRIQRKKPR
ncbi:MAG: hypothetical protein JSR36_05370 [Proteobacteria bacterium]|nr:hypothetical protein [Pseudomonadota bacterium]